MKMILTLLRSLSLGLLLGVSAAYADIPLTSDQQIVGTWRLEYTKKSQDTETTKERSDTWVIEKGKLVMKDIPQSRGDAYTSPPTDYIVEDGQFKVSLGRPGKFDSYTLINRTDDAMVLKDRMGVFYYFKKKK
jgi:hypothetical protein